MGFRSCRRFYVQLEKYNAYEIWHISFRRKTDFMGECEGGVKHFLQELLPWWSGLLKPNPRAKR